jgi:hypothetical protein
MMHSPYAAGDGALAYAKTADGLRLPVIDVTHPLFSIPDDPQSLQDLYDEFHREERRRRFVPAFVMRWMIEVAARKSKLMQTLFRPDLEILDGISTYILKLGPDNLVPPYNSAMDRKLAASPHVTFVRLRTQQTAKLIAEGLGMEFIAGEPGQPVPLHLINIGGGPAMDSLNALILLAHFKDALCNRQIVVHVLDVDDKGALFGRNALAAMMAPGYPLAGLDIEFRHQAYDWNDPEPLRRLIDSASAGNAIVAASSEGALFEYGSDAAIAANLDVLRRLRFVVGSVTRADETRQRLVAGTNLKLVLRGLENFEVLATKSHFRIEKVRSGIWSDQVLLRPN